MVTALLDAGADVNGSEEDGRTALHHAVFWGWPEIVRILIERKADVNALAGREKKYTPLSEAYRLREHAKDKARYDEVIRLLRSAGAR